MKFLKGKKSIPGVDILILTPIPVEFQAIRKLLHASSDFTDPQYKRSYCLGHLQTRTRHLKIALRKTGKGRTSVAEGAQQGISLFQPRLLILFGTAGGIKKVKIGDVVVGTRGYDYESGRVVEGGFHSIPRSISCTERLVELAEKKAQQTDWKTELPRQNNTMPDVVFSPIASGDKVITTHNTPIFTQLTERFNDALALEMESYAFLHAARNYPTVETLIIRGISDMLADKAIANQQHSRELAVTNAAAFLKHLLESEALLPIYLKSQKQIVLPILISLLIISFIAAGLLLPEDSNNDPLESYHATTDTFQEETTPEPPEAKQEEVPVRKPEQPKNQTERTKEIPAFTEDSILESFVDTIASLPNEETLSESRAEKAAISPPVSQVQQEVLKEETYLCHLYIFDPDGTVLTQNIEIDGISTQVLANEISLTKGDHQIRIQYNSNQVYETTIQVVPENPHKVFYLELP